MKDFLKLYTNQLKCVFDNLDYSRLKQICDCLYQAYLNQQQVFIMGNGGSAATASHFACDLAKGVSVFGQKPFRAVSLSDNVSVLTAWANDQSYQAVFVEQLKNLLNPNDLVIGISASGNSTNVLLAIEYARSKGAATIGLTGFDGGKLKAAAELSLIVPSNNMEQVEDMHLLITHILKLYLINLLKEMKEAKA